MPSSLDILSDRRPAKQKLYDPLRYGVLSSDDRSFIVYLFPKNTDLSNKSNREQASCVQTISTLSALVVPGMRTVSPKVMTTLSPALTYPACFAQSAA